MNISRAEIDTICRALPGTRLAAPPEIPCWKVGDRMFAFLGDFGEDDAVTVKCPDVGTAEMLIVAGAAEKARHLHASWVRLPFSEVSHDQAEHRIGISYDTVRSGLTKAVRETLPPWRQA